MLHDRRRLFPAVPVDHVCHVLEEQVPLAGQLVERANLRQVHEVLGPRHRIVQDQVRHALRVPHRVSHHQRSAPAHPVQRHRARTQLV